MTRAEWKPFRAEGTEHRKIISGAKERMSPQEIRRTDRLVHNLCNRLERQWWETQDATLREELQALYRVLAGYARNAERALIDRSTGGRVQAEKARARIALRDAKIVAHHAELRAEGKPKRSIVGILKNSGRYQSRGKPLTATQLRTILKKAKVS